MMIKEKKQNKNETFMLYNIILIKKSKKSKLEKLMRKNKIYMNTINSHYHIYKIKYSHKKLWKNKR